MAKLTHWFDGKKTIIGILVGAMYSVLIYYAILPDNYLAWTVIATWTGIAFRLGITKPAPVENTAKSTDTPPAFKYTPPGIPNEPPEALAG